MTKILILIAYWLRLLYAVSCSAVQVPLWAIFEIIIKFTGYSISIIQLIFMDTISTLTAQRLMSDTHELWSGVWIRLKKFLMSQKNLQISNSYIFLKNSTKGHIYMSLQGIYMRLQGIYMKTQGIYTQWFGNLGHLASCDYIAAVRCKRLTRYQCRHIRRDMDVPLAIWFVFRWYHTQPVFPLDLL